MPRIDALLVLMVLIWGVNYSVIKRAFAEIPPQPFNALRIVIASAVFLAAIRWARRRAREGRASSVFHTPNPLTTRDRWDLLWLGLVGHCMYQFCFVGGVALTSVSNAALIIGVTPVSVAVVSAGARPRAHRRAPLDRRRHFGPRHLLRGRPRRLVRRGHAPGRPPRHGFRRLLEHLHAGGEPADRAALAPLCHRDDDGHRRGAVRAARAPGPAAAGLDPACALDLGRACALRVLRARGGVLDLVHGRAEDRAGANVDLLERRADRGHGRGRALARRTADADEDHGRDLPC